jgi:hypothetical protein
VPQPVVTLVESGWRDLLVKTHLRLGEESQQWLSYIGVLDELLAIGGDMHREFDLRNILKQIKTGLQELGDAGGTATAANRGRIEAFAVGAPAHAG